MIWFYYNDDSKLKLFLLKALIYYCFEKI